MPDFEGVECEYVVDAGRWVGVRFRTMVVWKPDGDGETLVGVQLDRTGVGRLDKGAVDAHVLVSEVSGVIDDLGDRGMKDGDVLQEDRGQRMMKSLKRVGWLPPLDP
jgi:hypothetical protein